MAKNTVIELGKDWWKQRRTEPVKGSAKIELKKPPRTIRSTEFYTVKEVAIKLRRAYGWVLDRIHDGSIDAQPMPQGYLIPVDAVDAYLQGLRDSRVG